ncbi:hypothetical protein [Nonomuraea pusilla]|uniref:hypothetical protein n=1 Tax=Nonomuraea pusilla TaxID=46177 RepID=UPI000A5E8051|nr:hypothetical protein [Nonomuraea pusilla]
MDQGGDDVSDRRPAPPRMVEDPNPTMHRLPDLPFGSDGWSRRSDHPTPPAGSPAYQGGPGAQGGPGGQVVSPAFSPDGYRQPPFQTPPPPPPPQGRSKRALLVTLGALALAGVATGGFFAYRNMSAPSATTAAPQPTDGTPTAEPTDAASGAPTDAPGASKLNSEETDPARMALSEAFPKKKVQAAGMTFTRVKTDTETRCEKAATGAFAGALREQKCDRVLRATYVDGKRRFAVTTGIAVLPSKEAAEAADGAKDLGRNVWFRPLPGASGSGGDRVHIAGGYGAGLLWGRYIVFSYATYADGHTPGAKDKALAKVSGAFRDQASAVLEHRATAD